MSFTKKLEYVFIVAIVFSITYLAYSWFEQRQFRSNPLFQRTQAGIKNSVSEVMKRIKQHYGMSLQIPLIVSDEFHSRLYGLTLYKEGKVSILLNKKRFKESEAYMIEEVIPHEYAHAMLFLLGDKGSEDGHTQQWRKICLQLGGKECRRYVDQEEVIRRKMAF